MAIRRFFNQTVVVKRLRDIDSTRRSFQSTATVDGHIQAMDKEARGRLGIIEEKAWEAWFAVDAPIREGDKITDSAGVTYQVQEVVTKSYGINQHKEVILKLTNA